MSKIVRTEYEVEKGKPVIYAFCRENGKRVIIKDPNLVPYFYIKADTKGKDKYDIDKGMYESIDGTQLVKLLAKVPSDVPELRDKFATHFEADVLFPVRYLIDKVDKLEPTSPTIMFLDIETDNQGRVPSITLAPEPIICVTVVSNDIYTTFIYRSDFSPGKDSRIFWDKLHEINYFRTEDAMLNALVDFIRSDAPDVISGWNCTRFDLPYIINRMKRLGLDYYKMSPMNKVNYEEKYEEVTIKGVSVVDLMDAYKRFSETSEESYALDFIGKKVCNIGKTESASNVKWMWKFKPETLIEYNANDCRICLEVNNKMQLLEFMDELRRLCFCQLEDTLTMTKMSDSYILKLFHGRKVFPSRTHHEKEDVEGAMVESWANGLYKDVVVFDIRSLYPSAIISANLSPETICSATTKDGPKVLTLGNVRVKKNMNGFLPEVINTLFSERAKYRGLMKGEKLDSDNYKFYDMRQKAVKRLMNALYGQTAYVNSRIYNAQVAEATTWIGRNIITWSKKFLENIEYPAIYLDTDSLHVPFDCIDIPHIEMILGLINDSYNDFAKSIGLDKHYFQMEFDKIYRRAFYGKETKKRYAGAICYKDGKPADKLDIWGFEVRRSDASQLSKKVQETVFNMLLREDKGKEEVLRYIGDEIDRIRKGNFKFTEIGIPKAINKDLENYGNKITIGKDGKEHKTGAPANVRGARYAVKDLGIELSSKPKMIYVSKMPDKYKYIDVLCFDDDSQVPAGTQIDVQRCWKN